MQKLRHLLTLLVVLTLGFGTPLATFAAPGPMTHSSMSAESNATMADMQGGSDDCIPCASEAGVMQDCLPTCINVPALTSQELMSFAWGRASYDSPVEQAFSGANSRPDPYPPRPIILD